MIFGSRLSLALNIMVLEDLKLIGLDEVIAEDDEVSEDELENDEDEEDEEEGGDDEIM